MKKELQEGIDFYFDKNGYLVFTEDYHLERGYCCGHGCLHCPYNQNLKTNGKAIFCDATISKIKDSFVEKNPIGLGEN